MSENHFLPLILSFLSHSMDWIESSLHCPFEWFQSLAPTHSVPSLLSEKLLRWKMISRSVLFLSNDYDHRGIFIRFNLSSLKNLDRQWWSLIVSHDQLDGKVSMYRRCFFETSSLETCTKKVVEVCNELFTSSTRDNYWWIDHRWITRISDGLSITIGWFDHRSMINTVGRSRFM